MRVSLTVSHDLLQAAEHTLCMLIAVGFTAEHTLCMLITVGFTAEHTVHVDSSRVYYSSLSIDINQSCLMHKSNHLKQLRDLPLSRGQPLFMVYHGHLSCSNKYIAMCIVYLQ